MLTHEFPDTVFLPDRAELAINSLLGCLNSEKRQLPFCLTDLTGSPPRMAHTQFDYSDHTARVIDGMLLARAMTGMASFIMVSVRKALTTGGSENRLDAMFQNPPLTASVSPLLV